MSLLQTEIEEKILRDAVKESPDGNMIEVGVFEGDSAEFMFSEKPDRQLYIIDTFSGFKDLRDDEECLKNLFLDSREEFVRKRFELSPNIHVLSGYFPDVCPKIHDVSFAHIDVDTYTSTLRSLEWIYPKLVKGGIIIVHDYIHDSVKVKDAVDEFVIYDNIEFTKKGWINRNRILIDGKDTYITLPLKKASDYLDVKERYLAEIWPTERKKMLNRIIESYRKSPHFNTVYPIIEKCFLFEEKNLFQFILNSIIAINEYLGISTSLIISSIIPIDHQLK